KLMQGLIAYLERSGVKLQRNEELTAFEKSKGRISKVITTSSSGRKQDYEADEIILATGSWSKGTAALLDIKIPLMPGRGYSITLENSPYRV
ncbi:FAD-binding oxidoreductase, partial [Salmonella enterica subsp. enterica serovar Typhimurium]|uniref:NAD(P)/FAD-dependent oxidoreductase n=1 Tax=Salmonella enterica TaxID=28901 RepID=UPI0020A2448F